ncbi:MAG: alpha/beta hydrolase, partial [Eubacteriales bacterium]|nr:alpha/beta hydrolase [Eubacteriales bacterium]
MENIPLHDKKAYIGCEKPRMECYVQRPSPELTKEPRPAVIIFPGGGYEFTSDREAEPIANLFLSGGFSAFVVRYTVAPDCHEINPLIDAAQAVVHVRKNAAKYGVDPAKTAVCGFSAGGHLAAYISTCWNDEKVYNALDISGRDARPDASVLCYPVISAFNNPHEGSIKNLLSDAEPSDEAKKRVSLEYRVTESTPPAFIWTTANDDAVPASNSLDYAAALSENKVPYELHIFPNGPHGIALATRETAPDWQGYKENYISPYIARWGRWAVRWLDSTFNAPDYRT